VTQELSGALQETILFLRNSQSSDWASMSAEELVYELESILASLKHSHFVDVQHLGFLFAPTGAIQETAIDNGWGDDFLRLAAIVAQYSDSDD
jgi:hypothetical protein